MTLKELREYLFINSNQYFVGEKNLGVDDRVLSGLIKRALMYYGNAKPKKYMIYGYNIQSERTVIKFLQGNYSVGSDNVNLNTKEVVNILGIYLADPVYFNQKIDIPWKFDIRNKILWIPLYGTFNIEFLIKPTLEDISFDDIEFLDMCLGLYMMYVAKTRKSFTLSELPFANDSDEMYNEGKELLENARQQVEEETGSWNTIISGLIWRELQCFYAK